MAHPVPKTTPQGPQQAGGVLQWIERVGNKLPHPFLMFVYLTMFLAVLSAVLASLHVSTTNPLTHKAIAVKSLLTTEGLHWLLLNMIPNFKEFPPLGLVLTITLGIGLVEQVGLLQTFIKFFIAMVPKRFVTFAIIFLAFMSHLASDAAFVIMPPIGAMVFCAVGRHPLAGMAAAMAGVGSGFTANIFIAGTDVLLSGISTQAVKAVDPNMGVSPVDNWFFMAFSVIFLSTFATLLTEKYIEPRLGRYDGTKKIQLERPTAQETTALKYTGAAALLFIGTVAAMVVPEGAILRNPTTGTVLNSPFLKGIVPLILMFFFTIGITYGTKMDIIKDTSDIPKLMGQSIKNLSGFIVITFAIAQFIACFNWTNIGAFIAISGAAFLQDIGVTGLPAILFFMVLTGFLCLFFFSGSALWALLSTVFIPMFMMLGYNPAFIQMAYRVADSSFIGVAPTNPFLPLFLKYMSEYKSDVGPGTYFSLMIPYAIGFFLIWTLLMIVWYNLGLPIGPGIYPR